MALSLSGKISCFLILSNVVGLFLHLNDVSDFYCPRVSLGGSSEVPEPLLEQGMGAEARGEDPRHGGY